MNRKSIPAAVILALALLLTAGSMTFLGPCVHGDGSFGPCHWAGRAVTGVGALLAALGVLALAMREKQGLYLAMLPAATLGFAIPGTLIDLCGTAAMRCRMVMQPASRILFALMLAAALAGAWMTRRKAA